VHDGRGVIRDELPSTIFLIECKPVFRINVLQVDVNEIVSIAPLMGMQEPDGVPQLVHNRRMREAAGDLEVDWLW